MAAFISSQKTEHNIDHSTSCRAMGVSQPWYYKWKNRIDDDVPIAHHRRRADLDAQIPHSFEAAPMIRLALPGTCTTRGRVGR
ncbi:hypothetical protein [Nonomuraea rhizosphaerae]|uniref:hypothetical protein n=1 Tax=Nonomuraea rhizosphaerae TaxID=2665663 RepID=UPI001C5D7D35|nr:hypothetical protein [Nonomuraea rhizosphaerae]